MGASRTWLALGTAAALGVMLASCAPRKAPPPAPPPPAAPAPAPRAVALDPESYMAFSASSALFAVQASRMAEARAASSALRKLASQLVMDHTGVGAQLSFAGRRINLLPSSRPLPRHQAMLEQLASSSDFDRLYKTQMAEVLRLAARAHRAFEAGGESPTLRPVARFAAPVCEKNLAELARL